MSISKDDAEAIARKLHAVLDSRKNRPHALAKIYHENRLIAHFGIRHGSSRNAGHGHIPNDLHVSFRDVKMLAQCPMSREQWIEKLREKGKI